MRIEHINAKNPKELAKFVNNFVQHIEKQYDNEPFAQIVHDGKTWHAFVFTFLDASS